MILKTEFYQLPAPIIEVTDEHRKVILFSHVPFKEMSREDNVRACYLHACFKYVMRDYMTNTSLRERFGLDEKGMSSAPRYLKYIPYWA